MKKYHIADLLTAMRFLIAVVVLGLVFSLKRPNNWLVFWLFSIGELTDALDGEFARRFHYPNDGKVRFWREFNPKFWIYNYELYDIIADLALGISTILYIILRVNAPLGMFVFGGAIGVSFFVKVAVQNDLTAIPYKRVQNELKRLLIVRRRRWYIVALAVMFMTLLWSSDVSVFARLLMTLIVAFVGFVVASVKRTTRLKDDKTPL